jgi:hypothetical protein
MNPAEQLHEVYAHPRRVKVLAGLLSDLIPEQSRVLDVGCGDGMIDRAILDRRDDLSIDGVDVIRTFRSEYGSFLKRSSPAELVAELRAQNQRHAGTNPFES